MFTKTLGIKTAPTRMPTLGTRELDVLEILWDHSPGRMCATEVLTQIHQASTRFAESISVNTVQSTLERLVKKQLLVRTRQGRAYYYKTCVAKQQIVASLIRDIATDMSHGDMQVMISGFMDFVGAQDPDLSSKLKRALHETEQQPPEQKSD